MKEKEHMDEKDMITAMKDMTKDMKEIETKAVSKMEKALDEKEHMSEKDKMMIKAMYEKMAKMKNGIEYTDVITEHLPFLKEGNNSNIAPTVSSNTCCLISLLKLCAESGAPPITNSPLSD